jgi:adenosylcobinamide-GDP ribazoletransferase
LSDDDPSGVPHPRNDNRPPADAKAFGREIVYEIVGGLRFYSRVPIGFVPYVPPELTRLAPVLPGVSLILGIVPAALLVVFTYCGLPPVYAAAIAVAFALVLTGAMAEDALADAFDGLFGGPSPEVRLDIMRDSRHGTYGVSALVMLLLLRVFAIGGIAAIHPFAGAAAWLASGIVARSGSLWLPLALPPARATGVAAAAGRVQQPAFWVGAAIALVLCVALAIPFAGVAGVVVALAVAGLTVVLWTMICRRLIGGQTGDCVGALQALIEIAVLSVFFAFA